MLQQQSQQSQQSQLFFIPERNSSNSDDYIMLSESNFNFDSLNNSSLNSRIVTRSSGKNEQKIEDVSREVSRIINGMRDPINDVFSRIQNKYDNNFVSVHSDLKYLLEKYETVQLEVKALTEQKNSMMVQISNLSTLSTANPNRNKRRHEDYQSEHSSRVKDCKKIKTDKTDKSGTYFSDSTDSESSTIYFKDNQYKNEDGAGDAISDNLSENSDYSSVSKNQENHHEKLHKSNKSDKLSSKKKREKITNKLICCRPGAGTTGKAQYNFIVDAFRLGGHFGCNKWILQTEFAKKICALDRNRSESDRLNISLFWPHVNRSKDDKTAVKNANIDDSHEGLLRKWDQLGNTWVRYNPSEVTKHLFIESVDI